MTGTSGPEREAPAASGRRRVLDLLRSVPDGLGVAELAERSGPGRRSYLLLADMLAGSTAESSADPGAQGVELGRTWGRHLARRPAPARQVTGEESLAGLLRVLDDIGFAPALAEDDERRPQVLLRHCPFLEVANAHREVVCSLHLGVMQGVLTEQRADRGHRPAPLGGAVRVRDPPERARPGRGGLSAPPLRTGPPACTVTRGRRRGDATPRRCMSTPTRPVLAAPPEEASAVSRPGSGSAKKRALSAWKRWSESGRSSS